MARSLTLCVPGGTGFVGRHLADLLVARGHRLRIPTRHRERHKDLLVLPGVELVEADLQDDAALLELLAGVDGVINLVGILHEERPGDFRRVHVELPQRLLRAARECGARRFLHMSALGADARSGPSQYLRSKGEGEDAVHRLADPHLPVTSFRPAVIFGPDDHFFNRFARLLRLGPVLPLPCPRARLAPVFVGDVVEAFAQALEDRRTFGQRYELCGPRAYTLEELVRYLARVLGVERPILPLSDRASRLLARVLERLPGHPFGLEDYRTLQRPAVCEGPFPEVFGIRPTPVEAVVPYYLGRQDQRSLYDVFRRQARHEY